MPRDRDVAAFAERAKGYEEGWLGRLPTRSPAGRRRGKARTRRRATRLLARAGFRSPEWHVLYAVIIGAVTASK